MARRCRPRPIAHRRPSREPFDITPYVGDHGHCRRGAWASASSLQQYLGVVSISLVFLTAVLVTAVTYGLLPSLFACVVSVLAYNFFFLPPLYTFTIADPENVVALFFFLVVAVIASAI